MRIDVSETERQADDGIIKVQKPPCGRRFLNATDRPRDGAAGLRALPGGDVDSTVLRRCDDEPRSRRRVRTRIAAHGRQTR